MAKPTDQQFDTAFRAYEHYVAELRQFVEAMAAAGVQVRNVEPFADFAEIIVAREFGGTLQPAANEGFDLLTDDGIRIQVKSLRVSSNKPKDNGIEWRFCTRVKGKKDGELIKADRVAIVVYLDFRPYAMVDFPVEKREKFPVVDRKGLFYHHVKMLLDGRLKTSGSPFRVIDLRGRLPIQIVDTPPSAPAVGE